MIFACRADNTGAKWCYVKPGSTCTDLSCSKNRKQCGFTREWSYQACQTRAYNFGQNFVDTTCRTFNNYKEPCDYNGNFNYRIHEHNVRVNGFLTNGNNNNGNYNNGNNGNYNNGFNNNNNGNYNNGFNNNNNGNYNNGNNNNNRPFRRPNRPNRRPSNSNNGNYNNGFNNNGFNNNNGNYNNGFNNNNNNRRPIGNLLGNVLGLRNKDGTNSGSSSNSNSGSSGVIFQ